MQGQQGSCIFNVQVFGQRKYLLGLAARALVEVLFGGSSWLPLGPKRDNFHPTRLVNSCIFLKRPLVRRVPCFLCFSYQKETTTDVKYKGKAGT